MTAFGRKLTAAEAEAYLGGETMDLFRQQLMLVMLDRFGREVEIPVSEVDATGRFGMTLELDPVKGLFRLKLMEKS